MHEAVDGHVDARPDARVDPVEVVVGMGIQLLPLVPLVVAATLIVLPAAQESTSDQLQSAVAFVLGALGLATLGTAVLVPNRSGAYVGITIGAVLVVLARVLDPSRRGRRSGLSAVPTDRWSAILRRSRQGALIFTAAVYLVLALSPTMWLPREIISRRDGTRSVGFVLGSDADRTVVLTSHSRRVVHLDTSSIRRRELCVLRDVDRPLLFALLGGSEARYDECGAS